MRTLPGKKGFTLIEMLVAVTVLVVLLGILFAITNTVAKTIVNTSVKIDTFTAARSTFDLMSQKLSQATLNTYWDYDNPITPTVYRRQSDLQFLVIQNTQASGYGQEVYFTTPTTYSTDSTLRSTDGLLNACGYFISYGPDDSFKPTTLTGTATTAPTRYRYRLMQGIEPTENLSIYSNWTPTPAANATAATWAGYWTSMAGVWSAHAWINNIRNLGNGTPNTYNTPVANNIIALIIWPRLSPVDDPPGPTKYDGGGLTSNDGHGVTPAPYTYDSQNGATSSSQPIYTNQLPPTVQLTMIAISEASAARLNMGGTAPSAIETALNGKFVTATYTQYQADLASVTASLTAAHIAYEVLSTSVTMKESKWSDTSQ